MDDINMIRNKKIVFCIDCLRKGGAERVVSVLANNLSIENNVYIMTIDKEKIQYKLNDNISLIEIEKKYKKNNNPIMNKIFKLYKIIKKTKIMRKRFKSIKPDIIISFLPKASFMSVMANRKKYKLIISDRNDPAKEYNNLIHYILMKLLYSEANGFVFQTNGAKEYFDNEINLTNKKVDIIVNPVNPSFENYKNVANRKKKIISVCRLTEQKNIDLLIDAFYDLREKYKEYKLIIYGEGLLRDKLEDKIAKLKLTDQVKLPGIVDDVADKIYDSSLFVLTSNYEGIPNALIEAMVLGLPVIATDCPCGGPRMFIKNGENGYLINVNDKEDLKKKIQLILDNTDIQNKISINAKKIINEVRVDTIIDKWKKFIYSVIY